MVGFGAEYYEVSKDGLVRSLDRTDRFGRVHSGRLLRPRPDRKGYLEVNLSVDGVKKMVKVHHLVLEAFVGPRQGECRHLDGDVSNNCMSNLAWGTSRQNHFDQVQAGTHHNANKLRCPRCGGDYYLRPNGGRICRACQAEHSRRRRGN